MLTTGEQPSAPGSPMLREIFRLVTSVLRILFGSPGRSRGRARPLRRQGVSPPEPATVEGPPVPPPPSSSPIEGEPTENDDRGPPAAAEEAAGTAPAPAGAKVLAAEVPGTRPEEPSVGKGEMQEPSGLIVLAANEATGLVSELGEAGATSEAVTQGHRKKEVPPGLPVPPSPQKSAVEERTSPAPEEKLTDTVRVAGRKGARSTRPGTDGTRAPPIVSKQTRRDTETMPRVLPPEKRGGRPRGATTSGMATAGAAVVLTRPPQPELVCWEQGRLWYVGVQVPESATATSVQVIHDGQALQEDEDGAGRYGLKQLTGVVEVRWDQGQAEPIELRPTDFPLLFKLAGKTGHRVKYATQGLYVAVVPEAWQWDVETNGPPPFEPERCSVDGFRVYTFDTRTIRKLEFVCPDGSARAVKVGKQRFRLGGKEINDPSPHAGPLFAEVPTLRAPDAKDWADVETVVVGLEGPGKGKWRISFVPVRGAEEERLPEEVAKRGGGWYFIRLYDGEGALLESLDFQFLAGLHGIEVSPHTQLPGPRGHQPVTVRIVHGGECRVDLDGLECSREPNGTTITLPPDPRFDIVTGQISRADAWVTFTVTTRRVWWGAGDETHEPKRWSDFPVELHRPDFRATSHQALWIRYPADLAGGQVFVGFSPEAALCYRFEKNKRGVLMLPLRELGDSPELQGNVDSALMVWLDKPSGSGTRIATIALKFKCAVPGCAFEASSRDDVVDHVQTSHLTEVIRRVTDYRELREALPELRSLPRYIHRCCKCDRYFPSEDNRPDLILHHDCSKVSPSFEIIWDADRVRQYVLRDLPEVHKCKWGCVFKDRAVFEHLLEKHRDELYTCE